MADVPQRIALYSPFVAPVDNGEPAIYVGPPNGSDDTLAIRQAIVDANPARKIVFDAGTYYVSDRLAAGAAGISFIGQGPWKTIIKVLPTFSDTSGCKEASKPTSGPTVALAGAGAGALSNGVYRYRVTFVTAAGETDGGAISGTVTVANNAVNGKVALSGIQIGPEDIVIARRIYRTIADGAAYLLQSEIADNTTTTLTDNTADGALGAACPTTNTTAALQAVFGSSTQAGSTSLDRWANLKVDLNGQDIAAFDLGEIDSSVLDFVDIEGGTSIGTAIGTGIYFHAPIQSSSYTNVARDCRLRYLSIGVRFGWGGNQNRFDGGSIMSCALAVKTERNCSRANVSFARIEGNTAGIYENGDDSAYVRVQFENNPSYDFSFGANSTDCSIVSPHHATTPVANRYLNPSNVRFALFGSGVTTEAEEDRTIFSDGYSIVPYKAIVNLVGNGAPRINCTLAAGQPGQHLILVGYSWSVTIIDSTTAILTGGTATFGNGAGEVYAMELRWLSKLGKWVEITRHTKP